MNVYGYRLGARIYGYRMDIGMVILICVCGYYDIGWMYE